MCLRRICALLMDVIFEKELSAFFFFLQRIHALVLQFRVIISGINSLLTLEEHEDKPGFSAPSHYQNAISMINFLACVSFQYRRLF